MGTLVCIYKCNEIAKKKRSGREIAYGISKS